MQQLSYDCWKVIRAIAAITTCTGSSLFFVLSLGLAVWTYSSVQRVNDLPGKTLLLLLISCFVQRPLLTDRQDLSAWFKPFFNWKIHEKCDTYTDINEESLWLKAPRTGATRTLTWIARIHSHSYINAVATTLCKAPAQLLHNLESNLGGGANRSTRTKPQTACQLIGIT